jgi:hypothetical protein
MKTTVIESGKENTTAKNQVTDKSAIRPAVPLKQADNKDANDEPKPEAQTHKTETAQSEAQPTAETKAVAIVAEVPKAEPTKAKLREALHEQKPALNLDATIKFALDLNRRINQRGKLLETISTLEDFEVLQKDDADETESNHFQRCELTIEDDKGREFTTKNPFIINAVATMVNKLCIDKLAEIEGDIHFPILK